MHSSVIYPISQAHHAHPGQSSKASRVCYNPSSFAGLKYHNRPGIIMCSHKLQKHELFSTVSVLFYVRRNNISDALHWVPIARSTQTIHCEREIRTFITATDVCRRSLAHCTILIMDTHSKFEVEN